MKPSKRQFLGIHLVAAFALSLLGASPPSLQKPMPHRTLIGHAGAVSSLAFNASGTTLASSSTDAKIKLWNVTSGECICTLVGHNKEVTTVAFSPDGRRLASGSKDKTIKLWEVASGQCYGTLVGNTREIHAVAFDPQGKSLVSASQNGAIMFWDMVTGKNTRTIDYGPLDFGPQISTARAVAFSPDGKTLAAGGYRSARLFDVATEKRIATLAGHMSPANSVAFSPDGKTLASAGGNHGKDSEVWFEIRLWDTHTGKKLLAVDKIGGLFVTFSPDGKRLACAGGTSQGDYSIKILDASTAKVISTLEGHTRSPMCGAFNRDGKLLATGSQDKTIKLWDMEPAKAK